MSVSLLQKELQPCTPCSPRPRPRKSRRLSSRTCPRPEREGPAGELPGTWHWVQMQEPSLLPFYPRCQGETQAAGCSAQACGQRYPSSLQPHSEDPARPAPSAPSEAGALP